VKDLPVGAEIIQLGKGASPSEHLRFDWDLRQHVAMAGLGDRPIDLKLRMPDGQERWVTLDPDQRLVQKELAEFASIGIRPTESTTLSAKLPVIEHMGAGEASPPFEPKDRIVAVEGQRISPRRANQLDNLPAYPVEDALVRQLREPLTFQVERAGSSDSSDASPQRIEITVPPKPWGW
jgi:hypothetical protein